jgi:undecaprenyl-diphosphatase
MFSLNSLEGFLLKFFNIKGESWINLFDEKVFLWINNSNLNIATLMLTITYAGSTISWFGAAIFLWFLKKRKTAFLLIFVLLISGVLTFFMKIAFHRVRPFQILLEAKVLDKEEDFSFPSGHSVSSFSSATILGRKNRKISLCLYVFASLVAYSRIYVGVHWPSDVIFGGLIGVLISFLILKLKKKILNFFINETMKEKST